MSGMRSDKEGNVNSWLNLETLVCTNIVQPGVLYYSLVYNTGHNPNAGGPPYGELTVCFNEPFVFMLRQDFTFGVLG